MFGTRKDSFKNHLLRGHPLMMSEFRGGPRGGGGVQEIRTLVNKA